MALVSEDRCPVSFFGSERESDVWPILGGFFDRVNSDEFNIGHRNSLGLQEQVTKILVAAATVDQHANVPIDRLDHSEANLGPAVVRDAIHMS